MGDLLLNNLEVRSFRGFHHLKIEHLGRVNLIVGKNNVGKSALLEALRLYASKRSVITILGLLGVYDAEDNRQFVFSIPEERLVALKYLFYGRQDVRSRLEPIQIGPIDSEAERLTINVGWHKFDERGGGALWQVIPEEYGAAEKLAPYLDMRIEGKPIIYSLDWISSAPPFREDPKRILCVFRGPDGLSKREIGKLWDDVALTNLEQEILAALRTIAPGIERLNLVADPASPGERIPIVKVQGIEEPLPLNNLGDGMQRMLGIALALVNAKDGMLLIDEIENGLHYSVLPSLWQIIFRLAQRLNIQVFATSHSRDCIEAFQQVADADKQTEGMLIRLESKKGEIVATLFDERELGIATREQIEVR
jgi:hypothetical protein